MALCISVTPARAASLTVDLTGFFGPTTTLGGVALGTDTAFTLHAEGDTSSSMQAIPGLSGLDVYAVTGLTIEIAGKGEFVGIPDADTNIYLGDLTLDPGTPAYKLGLVNSSISGGFGGVFATASPGYTAGVPISSTLSNFVKPDVNGSYHMALIGLADGLVVNDLGTEIQTASILIGVPEPASLVMMGVGLLGVLGYRCGRRKGVA